MDEDLQEIEAELKRLRPRAPSPGLQRRIAEELDRASAVSAATSRPSAAYRAAASWTSWKWSGWQAAAVAVAAVVVLAAASLIRLHRGASPAIAATPSPSASDRSAGRPTGPLNATTGFEPVSVANVLYDLRDEGLVALDGQPPAQQVRYRYVDTFVWKDPKNNSSIQWSFPRDEVRVVPATFR